MTGTPDGRPLHQGCPRLAASIEAAVRDGSDPDRRRGRILSAPPWTTESLRAEGRRRRRGDRRRPLDLLRGARGPGGDVRLQARPVPDPRRAERPDRRRGALLLAVQQPARRRPADGHRQAHRRRLRLQLDLRQPQARRHACGCCRRAASSPRRRSTPTCCSSPAAAASRRSCRSPAPRWPRAPAGSCCSTPTATSSR